MKLFLNRHMKVLKGIYYSLVIILFAEIVTYSYFHLVNNRTKMYLEGSIHYDKNSTINFDANEVIIDIHEVKPKVIYEENGTKKQKVVTKKVVKDSVYRFNFDENYSKNCELYDNAECANSKKILGYSGNKLYLDKIYVSEDGSIILGLFEHNLYSYKYTYQKDKECHDKSFGKYTIKNNKIILDEKASIDCDYCVNTKDVSNKTFDFNNNTIVNFINEKNLILLDKYSDAVIDIAYEMGYFDGNILCKDGFNNSNY